MTYCRRCADPYLECSEHGIKSFDELLNTHALRMIKIGTYDKITAENMCKEIVDNNNGLFYFHSAGMKPIKDITSCKTIKSKVGTKVRLWEVFIMIKGVK